MSSHISTEEFLEQRGTDHPAPQERAGGAGTVASCLEKTLMPAKRLGRHTFYQVWCSRGKDVVLKAVFSPSIDSRSVELLLK